MNAIKRINKYLGAYNIDEIKPSHINDFLLELLTTETTIRKQRDGKVIDTGKPLAHSHITKIFMVLNTIFASAFRIDEIIMVNPMDKVTPPTARKDDEIKEVKACSVKEARHILECLSREPLTYRIIIWLLLDTGCRRGEIAGLRWQSVDFEACTIRICNNLQYSAIKGTYNTTPKGRKNRCIDVNPEIITLMQVLRDGQTVKSPDDYCFIHSDGKVISPQFATQYLIKFSRRYKLGKLHPHMLRHTAASIAITNGADIASVSAKLGHSDKSTTLDYYTHANLESIKRSNEIYRMALYEQDLQSLNNAILPLPKLQGDKPKNL
jgi:integrase